MKSKNNTILTVLILIAGISISLVLLNITRTDLGGILVICATVIVAFLNQKKNFFKL